MIPASRILAESRRRSVLADHRAGIGTRSRRSAAATALSSFQCGWSGLMNVLCRSLTRSSAPPVHTYRISRPHWFTVITLIPNPQHFMPYPRAHRNQTRPSLQLAVFRRRQQDRQPFRGGHGWTLSLVGIYVNRFWQEYRAIVGTPLLGKLPYTACGGLGLARA
jgi:hypothetical protein